MNTKIKTITLKLNEIDNTLGYVVMIDGTYHQTFDTLIKARKYGSTVPMLKTIINL